MWSAGRAAPRGSAAWCKRTRAWSISRWVGVCVFLCRSVLCLCVMCVCRAGQRRGGWMVHRRICLGRERLVDRWVWIWVGWWMDRHADVRWFAHTSVNEPSNAQPTNPPPNHEQGPLERTPLLIAADHCHLPVVRALLASGADVRDVDRSNANCLHLAVRSCMCVCICDMCIHVFCCVVSGSLMHATHTHTLLPLRLPHQVRGNRERCPEVVRELAAAGAVVSARYVFVSSVSWCSWREGC